MRAAHLGKTLGRHHSPETRAKLRLAWRSRKPISEETRAKLRSRGFSPEHRAKIGAASRGRRLTPETREKMRAANLGKHPTSETRAKIGAANKGKIRSEETRAKIGAAHKGRHHSVTLETRAKLRAANLGKHPTEETRAKLRAARARRVIPLKDTKPELAVQTLLRDCGIEFAKHAYIPGLNHQWDIKIESKKTLIEVDGCFWHECSTCKLPNARTTKSDIPCTMYAATAGWTVIRIRECEIKAGDFSKLGCIK